MDRRFPLFIALSVLVLMINMIVMSKLQPPPAPPQKNAVEAAAEKAVEEGVDDASADEGVAEEDAEDVKAEAPKIGAAPAGEGAAAAAPEQKLEYVSLGSIDEASGYRMLVTLTNRGAGVRRIELASPRYLDMTDRGGYLGHLELADGDEDDEGDEADATGAVAEQADGDAKVDEPVPDAEPAESTEAGDAEGLLVQAVGAGTPAADAGVKVGDRLVGAGTKEATPLASSADLVERLAKARPGTDFQLAVLRGAERINLVAKLVRRPLETTRPESENWLLHDNKLPPGFIEPPSFLMTLESVGKRKIADDKEELTGVNLRTANWEIVDRSDDSVTFRRSADKYGLTITKRYQLAKAAADEIKNADAPVYHVMLEVSIENAGAETRNVAYRLDGPNGLPIEGWWYSTKVGRSGVAGLRDVLARYFGAKPEQQTATTIVTGKSTDYEGSSLAYMGVDSQYFAVALIPQKEEADESWTSAVRPLLVGPKLDVRQFSPTFANVTCRLIGQPAELAPKESLTQSYQIFAGPKRPALLVKYEAAENPAYTLDDFVYYGWFGAIAQAMLGVLHFFYGIVGNYGLAIVMLTVLARGCMFPVSRSQARNMAKMQALKPEMDKLKEKFKGDQQKQGQAMQQLYRKHNVNPVAGCLPLFLQLPVFIGLYRGLAVDIELRGAPLISSAIKWCSNLAAPDMLWNWSAIMPEVVNRGQTFMIGLGPYLNLLPFVTIGLFLLQQKMFMPPAADEQAQTQQTIMKWMSIVISFLFYKVPSGLCVYLITSSLWGIGERKLVPPITPETLAKDSAAASKKASGGASSNGAFTSGRAKSKRRR